jgi:hypothetical protein
MPRFKIDFRQNLQPGAGSVNDRVDEHLLAPFSEFAVATDVQAARGRLEKADGHLKLTNVSPTGYSLVLDGTAADYVEFPDHADYDLGYQFTLDVSYSPSTVPGSAAYDPVLWRADGSNNKVFALEYGNSGEFLFTHRDAAGVEKTVTIDGYDTVDAVYHVRVERFYDILRIRVNNSAWSSRTDLDAASKGAAAATKLYVGKKTITDGATPDGNTARGKIDDLRLFRDALQDNGRYSFCEYPWLFDPRMVLYARFNDDAAQDYSLNENTGTINGTPTTDGASLVIPLQPCRKIHHMGLSDGSAYWCIWFDTEFYAEKVG